MTESPAHNTALSCYDSVLQAIAHKQKTAAAPVLVAIDGRCGSGKTGLARLIRHVFSCPIIHIDDFYLPFSDRPRGWDGIPGGAIDLDRILTQVLLPARAGTSILIQPFDCHTGTWGAVTTIPPAPLLVLEGSYSLHPRLRCFYDLTLFLTCSQQAQARRLKAREASAYSVFQTRWIPMEEQYFQRFQLPDPDSLVVDTTALF